MTAINKTATRTTTKVSDRTSDGITIAMMGAGSAIIGLWAVACFVGAMVTSGPLGMIRGYISAVTGI